MALKISRRAAAIAAGVTIAAAGLLATGGPASAATRPADSVTVTAVSHAAPSLDHSYGENYASGRAVDESRSEYSDGYSWYRVDYGLSYRWDGDSWIAQTADDTDFVNSLNCRYDDGQFYQWNGTQWLPGTGRQDDITQGQSLSRVPQIVLG